MSNLDGLTFYKDYTLEDNVVYNVINFLRYGFLEIGAYFNVTKGQTNVSGINESLVFSLNHPGITNNRVYQAEKPDWVWEKNFSLKYGSGTRPIEMSGIYVNNVWYPTGTAVSGNSYYLDYSRGRVIFTNPASGLSIEVPRSIRHVQIYEQDGVQHRQLEDDWIRNLGSPTGSSNIQQKIYLPAIIVGLKNYQTIKGTNLGSRNKTARATLQFDIFASNAYERKKLTDIIYFLETKPIKMFDFNIVPKPLSIKGELVNANYDWKYWVDNYAMTSDTARFMEDAGINKFHANTVNLYRARVTLGLELEIVVI